MPSRRGQHEGLQDVVPALRASRVLRAVSKQVRDSENQFTRGPENREVDDGMASPRKASC